jgi:hypothetical protein
MVMGHHPYFIHLQVFPPYIHRRSITFKSFSSNERKSKIRPKVMYTCHNHKQRCVVVSRVVVHAVHGWIENFISMMMVSLNINVIEEVI